MMKWNKRIASIVCALALLLGPGCLSSSMAEGAAQINGDKEEAVYAYLAADGTVEQVYVVNRFEVTQAGTLTDTGRYAAVTNLSGMEPIALEGDAVTLEVAAGNAYYQGQMGDNALPWTIAITYALDGEAVDAADLAGASGALTLRIATAQNDQVNSTFYEHYMLQISVTLDTERCSNIVSEKATIASAGQNKVISHTVLPGKDGDILISADVRDFSMSGIEIAGMPFSLPIELPDTDSMVEKLGSLTDAISSLNDGIASLAGGVSELHTGADGLATGSSEFSGGLASLNDSSAQLTEGSGQVKTALDSLAASLGGDPEADQQNTETGTEDMLAGLAGLPEALEQIAQGLGQAATGLRALKDGQAAMIGSLDAAIAAIPTQELSQEALGALAMGVQDEALQATVGQLIDYYAAAQTVAQTYTYTDPDTQMSIQSALAASDANLETLAASIETIAASVSEMKTGIETALDGSSTAEQLQQLAGGVAQLAESYGQIHTGLTSYVDGVGQLATSYSSLHGGIVSLQDGIKTLDEGAATLAEGSKTLNENVEGLPQTIQTEIADMLEGLDHSDFTPVSFASEDGTPVQSVQFVLMTEGIALADVEAPKPETAEESVWDRIRNLF